MEPAQLGEQMQVVNVSVEYPQLVHWSTAEIDRREVAQEQLAVLCGLGVIHHLLDILGEVVMELHSIVHSSLKVVSQVGSCKWTGVM